MSNHLPAALDPQDRLKGVRVMVGNTPLLALSVTFRESYRTVYVKAENLNLTGSIKDRMALHIVRRGYESGQLKPGDRIVEATSGNTGIALAMVAAMRGFRMVLIMPDNMSHERIVTMRAFGAEIILVTAEEGMMKARDIAEDMHAKGEARMLDQFANPDNPLAHYESTGPEIWRQTEQGVTHFVSSMGTTGTIMGCSRYFAEIGSGVEIVGVQPTDGSAIPGIRRWPEAYIPKIYDAERVDRIIDVSRDEADAMTRELARQEGIFCGISSGGAVAASLRLAAEIEEAHIVTIICDRGDRYLTTDVFENS